jgi:hypothetical protein
LGGFVAFPAHVQDEGEESDNRGEGDSGYAHGDDDFGEAERRRKASRE